MRMIIDGQTLPVKNLDTARIRSVAELQTQTGWKLPEIRSTVAENEAYSAAVVTFLSMRDEGIRTTWDEVLDIEFNEIRIIADPGDLRGSEATAPADPQQASGASAPGDETEAEGSPTED